MVLISPPPKASWSQWNQWFSKGGPWTSSTCFTWKFSRSADVYLLQVVLRPTKVQELQ